MEVVTYGSNSRVFVSVVRHWVKPFVKIQTCHSYVTVVSQLRHSNVTVVSQLYHSYVTVMSRLCDAPHNHTDP